MRRLLAPIVVLVAVLGLVASGCGGSQVAVPELASFTTVAQSSASSDSAQFELTFEMTVPGVGKSLSFTASGGFDTPAKRSRIAVDLSSLADLMAQAGPLLGGTVTGDLADTDPGDWKLDAIVDGDVVYLRFPPLASELPDGKTWVKGNAKELAQSGTSGLDQAGSLSGLDARDVFGFLEGVSGTIESVGSEDVRGVTTSHYRATLDPAKLTALVPADKRESLGGIDEAAKQAGLDDLPIDVWVDADGRLRKLAIELDAKLPGSDESLQASLVVEVYDYGAPLDVELPPADQVADAATLKPKSS